MCDHRNLSVKEKNKRKGLLLIIVVIFTGIIVLPGCSTPIGSSSFSSNSASRLENSASEIDRSASEIENSAKRIEENTLNIRDDATKIEEITKNPDVGQMSRSIQSKTSVMLSQLRNIQDQTEDIKNENGVVKGTAKSVQGLEDNIQEYENEGTAEAKKKLYNLILGMATFGGISVLGGIILFFFNPRMGALVAGFGLLTSVISIAGVYYLKWIAIWGISILGIALVVTLVFMIASFRKAKIYKESHEANVEAIEEMKKDLPEELKERVFSDTGVFATRQSKKVKNIVEETKQDLVEKKLEKPENYRWLRRR